MKPKNLKEAKDLADRYDSLTLEDLSYYKLQELTGFGFFNTCTLCKPLRDCSFHPDCSGCIYAIESDRYGCLDNETYQNVSYFATYESNPQKLLKAVKARARYIRRIIKKHEQ